MDDAEMVGQSNDNNNAFDMTKYDDKTKTDRIMEIKQSTAYKSMQNRKRALNIKIMKLDIDASLIESSRKYIEDTKLMIKNACPTIEQYDKLTKTSVKYKYLDSVDLNLWSKQNTLALCTTQVQKQLDELNREERLLFNQESPTSKYQTKYETKYEI